MLWKLTDQYFCIAFYYSSQLGTELNKRNPEVGIDIVDLEADGVCLRFSPMQSAPCKFFLLFHVKNHILLI